MDQVQEVRRNRAALAGSERVETLMLEGELGEDDLTRLCEDLMHRLHRGIRQVVLDFADVSHLNYRGVRPLVARTEAFRRAGGDVKLSGLSPYLAAIFRAAGAHEAFELYPHMNDARAAFSLSRAPFV
ncbi:STAS domain-containing protein [Corallococcus llansteffanensis]|uniref:Anti-sigma factor antagonist n=1 Tax=Corallococcus llansteffanensis TaxID=2316731 RepID=A0A3A8QE12_9BACT|nr:STAS domain-containing protein [Corallococcus llansteffanensis]RKH66856.1 anti-sigma factor antagonist [Corallococcus llansteffanensis]